MSFLEKSYAIFAIAFALFLAGLFMLVPETRAFSILLPLSFGGLLVNVGLMFVVLKDIFTRPSLERKGKIAWTAILLLCWPAIPIYLVLHGFTPRESD